MYLVYQMSSIWIPYLIFRNTDNDEAVDIQNTRTVVSIKKQGNFIRSGLDIADEVVFYVPEILFIKSTISFVFIITLFCKIEIFNGWENMITLNQSHSKKFHCTYLMHYYPFDTQVRQRMIYKAFEERSLKSIKVVNLSVCLVHLFFLSH